MALLSAHGFYSVLVCCSPVFGSRCVAGHIAASSNTIPGKRVILRGFHVAWPAGAARLHVCHESIRSEDRVLVIAPHPDDAELAAFGLYADTRATIVTVTAGDGSARYTGKNGGMRLTRTQ